MEQLIIHYGITPTGHYYELGTRHICNYDDCPARDDRLKKWKNVLCAIKEYLEIILI